MRLSRVNPTLYTIKNIVFDNLERPLDNDKKTGNIMMIYGFNREKCRKKANLVGLDWADVACDRACARVKRTRNAVFDLTGYLRKG